MDNKDNLEHLYTGTEININVLKEILDDNQIPSLIKNNMNSGLAAGFGGGYMEAESSIFVSSKDLDESKNILEEFLKSIE